jgi:hypothetical protein
LNKTLHQEKVKTRGAEEAGVGAAATSVPVAGPASSMPMGRMAALQTSSSAEDVVHSDASEASETSDISKTSAAKSQALQTRTLRSVVGFVSNHLLSLN